MDFEKYDLTHFKNGLAEFGVIANEFQIRQFR